MTARDEMPGEFTFTFWGTRGSIPSPGPATVRYGGNTPCVEVRVPDGALVILDAGTGIRALGEALARRAAGETVSGDIFLSHAHWDHIQGLPFFAPLYERGNRFRIWTGTTAAEDVERAVRAQMSEGVFPVLFDDVEATMEFRTLDGSHSAPSYTIDTLPVRHPGGALGFRLRAPGDVVPRLVYIPDNELAAPPTPDSPADWRDRLVAFAHGASILVHDATFTAAEYETHRGWGHSRYDDALSLALEARVERLVLFHHSPDRADDDLDAELERLRRTGPPLEIIAAREGMVLRE
ncbi:MAG TPA: MBL fold metallo-hydrolase [Gemmatimonadaceae bacterium]|nr:MBL fold metallo-hydrolase [Gemmatimonadaceae bacterium]